MVYDPRAVANLVLDIADSRGLAITNMALNKIIYFAHGWSLGQRGRPLVNATFEAWQHGPVLPLIYRQFSAAGAHPIESRATSIDVATGRDVVVAPNLIAEDVDYLMQMIDLFGPMTASSLRNLSHEVGGPWDLVWNGREKINPGMVISHTAIESHFRQRMDRKNRGNVH